MSVEAIVYLVVPAELAAELHEPLREHFAGQAGVEVVVERRGASSAPDRLASERRAAPRPSHRLDLPGFARPYAERLLCLELVRLPDVLAGDELSMRVVARFQAGEAAAFDELYARYFGSVYSYLSGALRDPHEAEDLAQETWIRVRRGLARFEARPGVPFRRWLFRIARRVLLDELARRGRMNLEPLSDDHTAGAGSTTDQTFGERWFARPELHEAVDQLPPAGRQVVLLRHFVGLEYSEIAVLAGRSYDAVRQLNSRMLRELERSMKRTDLKATKHERRWMRVRLRRLPVLGQRRWCLCGDARHHQPTRAGGVAAGVAGAEGWRTRRESLGFSLPMSQARGIWGSRY